jgi:hypothetical protein
MAVDLFPLFYSREELRRCHWVGPELLVIGLKYVFDLFIFLFCFPILNGIVVSLHCLVVLVCAFVLCFSLHPKCSTAPIFVTDLTRMRARLSESRSVCVSSAVAPSYWPESAESLASYGIIGDHETTRLGFIRGSLSVHKP